MRNAGVDAVRVIGIVAVVAGHVWGDNVIVREFIYSWHVPVFFILTGYFWTSGRSLVTELGKRSRTLAYPYITWLILISVAFIPWQIATGIFSSKSLLNLVLGGAHLGRPYSAFWFVSALFFGAIIYRLVERLPVAVQWILAAMFLAVAYVVPAAVAAVPLSAGVALPALAFMLVGALFRRYRSALTRPLILACALLAPSIVLIATGISQPLDMKQSDFGTPVVSVVVAIAIGIALILIFETVVPLLGNQTSRIIISLGSVGLMVVLTHAVVLWILATPPSGSLVAFLLALVVPWSLALILVRTPLARFVIGIPQAKPRVRVPTP